MRVAAIRYAYKLARHDELPTGSEVVRATMRGIRRRAGQHASLQGPLRPAERVVAMVTTVGGGM
jgi:hypothetical protein